MHLTTKQKMKKKKNCREEGEFEEDHNHVAFEKHLKTMAPVELLQLDLKPTHSRPHSGETSPETTNIINVKSILQQSIVLIYYYYYYIVSNNNIIILLKCGGYKSGPGKGKGTRTKRLEIRTQSGGPKRRCLGILPYTTIIL